ncbi:TolB-like translocation protein [Nocardioides pyridinolyticus]
MTDLHDLLELATDRVEPTGGAAGALATARRRRRTRRGAAASAAAVVVIGAIALGGRLGDGAPSEPEPAPPVETVEPVPLDPSRVDELPTAAPEVAPLLPDVLCVPDVAPRIEEEPMEAAVVSVDDDADVLLLGTDGRWHCVVVADRSRTAPVLSPDGTRLAVGVTGGFEAIDLATGERTFRTQEPDFDRTWEMALPRVPAGWVLRPVAQLDDGTALLFVAPGPRTPGGWRVVHWDPATGGLAAVTRASSSPANATSFAADLLG